MSGLAQYLLAQAERQPLATVQFAAGELWRRGRMRWANSIEKNFPALQAVNPGEAFAPFLPKAAFDSAEFQRRFPQALERIVASADGVCRHEFDILGTRYVPGPIIDWHLDWTTGHRWPCVPPRRLQILRTAPASDVKRPWELARFHQALTLGKAYALTGDEVYAREFQSQVRLWRESNPYPCGIHWAMPLEIAVRAVNLCVAGAFFARATTLQADFWQEFSAMLFLHGRYLHLHREWNPIARANHHLGCLAGLLCLGALFPNEKEGRAWFDGARTAICAEMDWQVGADGVAHEGSSNYHAFVTEMMLTAAVIGSRAEAPGAANRDPAMAMQRFGGAGFCEKLERMFEFPAALREGRHAPPVLGDSDDGRLLPFCEHGHAHPIEHLLAMGRAAFGRNDWPASGHACEQAWWLLGPAKPQARTGERKRGFAASGFYFFASDRIRGSVRCGPLGVKGWANHAHCDQLHVEFCLDGLPVIVDAGSYLYSGDAEERNRFRSSRSHNAPVVAGQEQNRYWPGLLFRMVDDTRSKGTHWEEGVNAVHFTGEHRGYERLADPVAVRREVHLDRARHSLIVRDRIDGRSSTSIEWFWLFAPGLEPAPVEPLVEIPDPLGEKLVLHSAWRAGGIEMQLWLPKATQNVRAAAFDGWFAPRYGVRVPARGLHVHCDAALPLQAVTRFVPRETPHGQKS